MAVKPMNIEVTTDPTLLTDAEGQAGFSALITHRGGAEIRVGNAEETLYRVRSGESRWLDKLRHNDLWATTAADTADIDVLLVGV